MPGGRELPLGQDSDDEAAVDAPVAVLEGADVDETEGGGSCLQHPVKPGVAHAVVRRKQAGHQALENSGPRANELGRRVAEVVPFAQKHPVEAQAWAHKAGILEEKAVQAGDFIEGEPVSSGLHHRAAPSLQPGARHPFALYLETRPAVAQQHEAGGEPAQIIDWRGKSCSTVRVTHA